MKVQIDGVDYVKANPRPTGTTLLDALELSFCHPNSGDQITIRRYLYELLAKLWDEGDSFESKRPFGNSDWEFDLYAPLAKAGFIDMGILDENGDFYVFTTTQVNLAGAYVSDLIAAAFFGVEED